MVNTIISYCLFFTHLRYKSFLSWNTGDDFRRGDFMFTPVVKSVMKSVAAEAKQKGVRINAGTSAPPRQPTVPEGDIKSRLNALRRKRNAVNFSDKKNGRTVARGVSRSSLRCKRETGALHLSTEEDSAEAAPAPVGSPACAVPAPPKSLRPSSASVNRSKPNRRVLFKTSTGSESVTGNDAPNSPGMGGADSTRQNDHSLEFDKFSSSPPRRRPDIKNQKSQYSQDRLRKKNLSDQDSWGQGKQEDASDSSSDDAVEFNTFQTKGYTRRKRAVSVGAFCSCEVPGSLSWQCKI